MAGEEQRPVGHTGQALCEALIHVLSVAAGQIGAAAALQEKGVTGQQTPVDEEALAARCMARGVDELHAQISDRHHATRRRG